MICRHCGKNIPEEAVFCPFCGEQTESHLRREKTESHLRKEDRLQEEMEKDKPENKKEKKKKEKYYEEPAGKRMLKSFISIIAAFVFVAAAFIAIMVFVKPYLGEEPWPDEDEQGVHDDYQDSEFGGAETSVGQLELILQVSIGIHIDCQCKIQYKNEDNPYTKNMKNRDKGLLSGMNFEAAG